MGNVRNSNANLPKQKGDSWAPMTQLDFCLQAWLDSGSTSVPLSLWAFFLNTAFTDRHGMVVAAPDLPRS